MARLTDYQFVLILWVMISGYELNPLCMLYILNLILCFEPLQFAYPSNGNTMFNLLVSDHRSYHTTPSTPMCEFPILHVIIWLVHMQNLYFRDIWMVLLWDCFKIVHLQFQYCQCISNGLNKYITTCIEDLTFYSSMRVRALRK